MAIVPIDLPIRATGCRSVRIDKTWSRTTFAPSGEGSPWPTVGQGTASKVALIGAEHRPQVCLRDALFGQTHGV